MDSGVTDGLADLRVQLGGEDQKTLFDYWLAKRGSRRMPARADLDPVDIVKLLPNLMLIDVIGAPPRFRYRLVGTRVVQASGNEDRTGHFFEEYEFYHRYPHILAQYRQVVATGSPLFAPEPFRNREHGTSYEVERLLLPLGPGDEKVDMILVHFRFTSGPYSAG
jgi:hypothetical protein